MMIWCMNSNLFAKMNLLLSSRKIFKNWYLYLIVYFKLTKNKHVIFETKAGQKIKIRVNSTDLMALTHVWLIQEYRNDGFNIETNDIIIDVGAHIGLFALYASQFCKNGKIICYEPIKENYDLLLENIKQNKISNIIPYNSAVSSKSSTVKIYLNEDESGHSMFSKSSESIIIDSISVLQTELGRFDAAAETLSTYLSRAPRGHDLESARAALSELRNRVVDERDSDPEADAAGTSGPIGESPRNQ